MDCRVPAAAKVDLMSQCPQVEESLLACKIRRKRPPTVPCLLHSDMQRLHLVRRYSIAELQTLGP